MNLDELRSLYMEAVKIIRAEREMRRYVFASSPEKQEAKLAEMDRLLDILRQIKDAAKAEFEQPKLLDVPRKYE